MLDIIFFPLLVILKSVLAIYIWIIIGHVVINWLVVFQIVNYKNNFVKMVLEFLSITTEPILSKIRKILPLVGSFDFSPFILILIVWFLEGVVGQLMMKAFMVGSG